MKVFKFGGASVKDAESVKNVSHILKDCRDEKIAIVLSAMGKNTNKLEDLSRSVFRNDGNSMLIFKEFKEYHLNVILDLFPELNTIPEIISKHFDKLEQIVVSGSQQTGSGRVSFDKIYDIIVPFGEIISTSILFYYLSKNGNSIEWVDAGEMIKTDDTYREARVKWEETRKSVLSLTNDLFRHSNFIITQGFIGATDNGEYTTLGREGSDYTASILANILDAEECVIWKDVQGVLNADPESSLETELISKLSYKEAIELTYYGAKVIHPKTIKPLENKNIPLLVKSFKEPWKEGTIISSFKYLDFIPLYIFKKDQVLVSIAAKDLSFITESSLHRIFGLVSYYGAKINLMQSSAISFSICIDNTEKLEILIKDLQKDFFVRYNESLEIITIRHYDEDAITKVLENKMVILEQRSRSTIQMVVENNT